MEDDKVFYKVIWTRFLRGFVEGGLAGMIVVAPSTITSWGLFVGFLNALLLACLIGGISGGLQAVSKALRWK